MDQAGWTVYQYRQGDGETFKTFRGKAEAAAFRVKCLADWRESGRGRTATKHLLEGQWVEVDGFDLKERGYFGVQVVGFTNLFPARDR